MNPVFVIPHPKATEHLIPRIREMILAGLRSGEPVVVELRREDKTREQEKKYHAMIRDIAQTVYLDKKYSTAAWKALLVDQFEHEMSQDRTPLKNGGKVYISLDGQRAITERASTKRFLKAEGSKFIEFLYAFGIQHGAKFSEESEQHYANIGKN